MKLLQLPKNKGLRILIKLIINVGIIAAWPPLWNWIYFKIINRIYEYGDPSSVEKAYILVFLVITLFLPIFLITVSFWFNTKYKFKFFGLFDKLKKFKKLEPRIYTNTSNADELKKYADLRDQGIITEEEFQAKKKKLLDL